MPRARASKEPHNSPVLLDGSNSTIHMDSVGREISRVPIRARSGLKKLDPSKPTTFLFSAREGNYDRLKIRLKGDVHLDRAPALYDLVARLRASPRPDRILSVSKGLGRDSYKLKIDSKAWLFSGAGHMRLPPDSARLSLDLVLDLNYIRFIAHQETSQLVKVKNASPRVALRKRIAVSETIKHVTIDCNDNLLIDTDRIGGTFFHFREQRRKEFLAVYLNKILQLLKEELEVIPNTSVSLQWSTVMQAEVAWELEQKDALTWLTEFRKTIFAATPHSVWRRRTLNIERKGNSDWINVPLTKKISVRVYAKAPNRVRLELVYSGHVREEVERHSTKMPYATTLATLLALPEPAARRLHEFWEAVLPYIGPAPTPAADILEFLGRFTEAVPPARQRTFLSLLANGRGITETSPNGVASSLVCRALEKTGVLIKAQRFRHGIPQRYVLHPSISKTLDAILGRTDSVP